MKVGFDFRAMQAGHELRGIGEVLRNAVTELDARLPASDGFVIASEARGRPVRPLARELVTSGRRIESVAVPVPPSDLRRLDRLRDNLSAEQHRAFEAADVLVQVDFGLGVPERVPTVLFVHDLIPLELGDRYPHRYLPRYRAARRRGMPVVEAATRAGRRQLYVRNLTRALTRADRVLTNSAYTAATAERFAADHGVDDLTGRLRVARLGCRHDTAAAPPLNPLEHARLQAIGLEARPFVFFVGGADERRRLDLLVDAFNHLRSRRHDLQIVLAGDTLATLDTLQVSSARDAISASSYHQDIHLLGYVSRAQRQWLYEHAAALVFPSELEGFGLPVIEALAAGCPVVAFDNSAMPEVAGPGCHLVGESWRELADGIADVLDLDPTARAAEVDAGRRWAGEFTWDRFGTVMAAAVEELRPGRGGAGRSAVGDERQVAVAEDQ
jgi:glycosyltransferase involved in cell wall biosynthesis